MKSDIVYEDDAALAFRDISPQAPVHILVIPKARIPQLSKATDDDAAILGHLLNVARKVADQEKLEKGKKWSQKCPNIFANKSGEFVFSIFSLARIFW